MQTSLRRLAPLLRHSPSLPHLTARHLSTPPPTPVDVLIVGGGLVGSTLAASIASNPLSETLSVALVDPSPPPSTPPTTPSLRTSTISPSSTALLHSAGIWQHLPSSRIAPFNKMLVWDQPDASTPLGAITFTSESLGTVVDNTSLRCAIYTRLSTLPVRTLTTHVASVTYPDPEGAATPSAWPEVALGTGEMLSARLVIAADGARSRIRALAGFDWHSHAYDQTAVVANVRLDAPVTTAFQRFLSTGPIALLPLAGDAPMANIIWSTTLAEAEALSAADDVVFVDEVNAAFREADFTAGGKGKSRGEEVKGQRLPVCKAVVGPRGRFPLAAGHAPRYVDSARRTVLLGDAAHAVHPLAGQGANLGFADVKSLSEALANAAATGRDIGGEDGAPLMRYERDRVAANVAMMGTLHAIQAAFGQTSSPVFNIARRLGVSALDRFAPMKEMILKVMN